MDEHSYAIRTYFKVNRVFMASTGVWPYQSPKLTRIIRTFWIMQHISIMVPEIIKLIEVRQTGDIVLECIPSIFYNVVIAIMYGNTLYHQRKMKGMLEKIHENWESITSKREVEVLTRYADTGKTIAWLYIGTLYYTLLIFCLFPLSPIVMDYIHPLNGSRQKLPLYRVQLFIDPEKYYWTILMHAYATTLMGIIPLLIVDIFLTNCTQHVCSLMIILGFIVDMNSLFGTSFGVLLSIMVTLTGMTGIVVLIKWGDWREVIRFGLFTMAELFHLFCYSYHSQDIIDHNDKLYKSIGNSGWYDSSIRTQVLIRMMFLRCSRPCLLQCIIFPMSMETFTALLKSIFSYFTVVKSCRY